MGQRGVQTLFLQWLPRELRLLLIHEDLTDVKGLADKADRLHNHHREVIAVPAKIQDMNLEEDDT
jgi:hypothetical protein